ncbi:MAG: VCBS repeat-containing protein [Acidobacteria bacterium]|nr:VCBS repeat-containing protein [Acidobacteriota bacterium]
MPRGRTILIGGLIAAIATATTALVLTWRATEALPALALTDTGLTEIPELSGRRVNSPAELDDLLRDRSFAGRVIIPRDVVWKMERCDRQRDEFGNFVCTPILEIPLYSRVQLVGERGELGSRPLLFTTIVDTRSRALFEVCGNDVLVQGLHLRGPQPGDDHATKNPYVIGIRVHQNAEDGAFSRCEADRGLGLPERFGKIGHRVLIVDNEFDQWTGGAVTAIGGHQNTPLNEWGPHTCSGNPDCCDIAADGDICWQPLTPADAGLVRIERNFMHHNARDEGGYGVDVSGGAYVTIMGNVLNHNRHGVAASGRAHSGYVARFNYVLQGGYREGGFGSYYNQHFDVHGEGDDGYGGAGGTYFEIAFNTIRGDQRYAFGTVTRPAFMLRGVPAVGMDFMNNVVVHSSLRRAVRFKRLGVSDGLAALAKFRHGGNRFAADYASELAAGDFDGDGRTDVFVANGTAWFFSRAGRKPWEFLHASTKRLEELGFADIDNDAVTDVLYRDGTGHVGYLKSGRDALVPLTTMPVAMKDLRVGDFDGDGKTDLFFTRNGGWQVWHGSTRTWTPTQTSQKKISELLFGEFDEVKGTDVATVLESGWVYSSGSVDPWAPLNSKLTDSFTDAVVADFDGNGKTDIAFRKGFWRISADGRGPIADLHAGSIRLNRWIVGHFESGAPAMAVAFGPPLSSASKRFVIWRGPASGKALHPWSEHDMQ